MVVVYYECDCSNLICKQPTLLVVQEKRLVPLKSELNKGESMKLQAYYLVQLYFVRKFKLYRVWYKSVSHQTRPAGARRSSALVVNCVASGVETILITSTDVKTAAQPPPSITTYHIILKEN